MDSETRVKEAVTAVAAEQKVRKYTVSPHNSFSFSKNGAACRSLFAFAQCIL